MGADFEQIVRDHLTAVTRHAVMLTGDRELARDLVQDVGLALTGGRELTVTIQDLAPTTSTVSTTSMSTAGRRIAADIRYDVHDRVTPPLTITDLPAGLTIADVSQHSEVNNSIADHLATSYTLQHAGRDAATISIAKGAHDGDFEPTAPGSATSQPAKPSHPTTGQGVQSHPSIVISGATAVEIIVRNFEPGRELVLVGRLGVVSVDDLYRIADGLRWSQ